MLLNCRTVTERLAATRRSLMQFSRIVQGKFGSLATATFRLTVPSPLRVAKALIPIYPNKLPNVPKPSRASRAVPLVFNYIPASQGAITRLLNRCRGQNLYRGFESPPLRHR